MCLVNSLGRIIVSVNVLPNESVTLISRVVSGAEATTWNICAVLSSANAFGLSARRQTLLGMQ